MRKEELTNMTIEERVQLFLIFNRRWSMILAWHSQ